MDKPFEKGEKHFFLLSQRSNFPVAFIEKYAGLCRSK